MEENKVRLENPTCNFVSFITKKGVILQPSELINFRLKAQLWSLKLSVE